MRVNYFVLFLSGLLLLAACDKKEEKNKNFPSGDSLASDSLSVSDSVLQRGEAPSWFKQKHRREGFLYALGQAHSRDRLIARKKALLRARVALAESLLNESKHAKRDSLNVFLRHSYPLKEKAVKKGTQWYYYVWIEMPIP